MKEGWVLKQLGELTEVITKGTTPTSVGFEFESEGINFVKIESITLNGGFIKNKFAYITDKAHLALNRSQLKDGDILFSIAGALGRTAIVTNDILPANTNQALAIIRLKDDDNVLKQYVLSALTSGYALEQVEKFKGGVAQQNLSLGQMKCFEIPIPPLPEQKQIVAILNETFEAIEQAKTNIKKNIKNAKELFQSKLNDIFSRKGEGWEKKTLGEIGKVSMCKRILKKQTAPNGDIPFYKIGTFGKKANAFISKEIYDEFRSKYSFPEKGDILISASGTIGRRVRYDGMPAYFQDSNIVWINNDEELVTNDYLYQFYGICDWNPSKGATISRLYNHDLRKIKISYPSIAVQKQIVPEMEKLKEQTLKIESNYKRKLNDLDELKKSILLKAFAGELTRKMIEA